MKEILKEIDNRVEKLKLGNSKNNHYLFLTEEEYKTLKDSLTEIPNAQILIYRKCKVRIKGEK